MFWDVRTKDKRLRSGATVRNSKSTMSGSASISWVRKLGCDFGQEGSVQTTSNNHLVAVNKYDFSGYLFTLVIYIHTYVHTYTDIHIYIYICIYVTYYSLNIIRIYLRSGRVFAANACSVARKLCSFPKCSWGKSCMISQWEKLLTSS